MQTLNCLNTGERALIARNTAPDALKARLLSMGFIRGNAVKVLAHSLAGATVMVKINEGESYSLRHSEAEYLLIEAC